MRQIGHSMDVVEVAKVNGIIIVMVALMVVKMLRGFFLSVKSATANLKLYLWSICLLLVAVTTLRKDHRRVRIRGGSIFHRRTLLR
jgi:hypothetical protein